MRAWVKHLRAVLLPLTEISGELRLVGGLRAEHRLEHHARAHLVALAGADRVDHLGERLQASGRVRQHVRNRPPTHARLTMGSLRGQHVTPT